jgi:hypothetical protein
LTNKFFFEFGGVWRKQKKTNSTMCYVIRRDKKKKCCCLFGCGQLSG